MANCSYTCACMLSHQLCRSPCDPMDYSLPDSSAYDSPGKSTEASCHALLHSIFPTQESSLYISPVSPALQANSLSAEPPGKPIQTCMFPQVS